MSNPAATISPEDFTPISKGAPYPGFDSGPETRVTDPRTNPDAYRAAIAEAQYVVKARYREANGQKHGVARRLTNLEECDQAVASLRALPFAVEFQVIDLLLSHDRNMAAPEFGSPGWHAWRDARQKEEPAQVGAYRDGVWERSEPGVVQAATT
jgi:hypothetical protein